MPSIEEFTPQSIYSNRFGRQVRVYAHPKNVFYQERLQDINGFLSVEIDPITDAIVITFDKEYIIFAPSEKADQDAIRACLIDYTITNRHFGPVIQPKLLTRKTLAWSVTHSPGVNIVRDGWQFASVRGVQIGLFMTGWKDRFENRVTWTADTIELNLSGVQDDVLNLDPETVSVSNFKWCYNRQVAEPNWNNWRTVLNSSSQGVDRIAVASGEEVDLFQLERTALRFDTTAVDPTGSATTAVLHMYYNFGNSDGGYSDECHVSRCSFDGTLSSAVTYGVIFDGYTADPIGYMSGLLGDISGWTELDVFGKYSSTTTFDLGLASQGDVTDAGFADSPNDIYFDHTGGNALYLEMEIPGPPVNTLLTLNVGK